MKKIIVLSAGIVVLSLTACGQKREPSTPVPPMPKTSEAGPQMGSLPSTTPSSAGSNSESNASIPANQK